MTYFAANIVSQISLFSVFLFKMLKKKLLFLGFRNLFRKQHNVFYLASIILGALLLSPVFS